MTNKDLKMRMSFKRKIMIKKKKSNEQINLNCTLQRVCLLRKLNGAGLLSGKWTSAKDRSTDSFTILGGVPVLRRPTLSPSRSLSVWDRPALDGASPIRPPGLEVWPTNRDPDRKVPVVRITELAEIFWLPFAVHEHQTVINILE